MSRRRARGWRERGNYGWRVRKPHAPLGLPIIGRHWGYVGQSGSRKHRDRQHRFGNPDGGQLPSFWSDLDAKVYPLPSLPWWKWSRELSERFWVAVLCPVYNVQLQPPWNLRKISKSKARAQREARDRRRRESPGSQLLVDILVTAARLGIGAFAIVVAYYLITRS